MKSRLHLHLDEDLSERLDHLAAKPGATKSAIMADALRSYLNRKAGNEIDDLLKRRLDRMSTSLARVEREFFGIALVLVVVLAVGVRVWRRRARVS